MKELKLEWKDDMQSSLKIPGGPRYPCNIDDPIKLPL